MKKLIFSLCALMFVVLSGVAFTGCSNKIDSIAIKEGIIKTEYYVGESFNPDGSVLIAKSGNKYFEVALTDKDVKIENFSTKQVVENAVAKITYKGKSTEFTYSVSLRQGLDFSLTGGTYTYDKTIHDVNLSGVMDGATVTKTYVEMGQEKAFEGAVNAGTYVVRVTVTKDGYEPVTKSCEIKIEPKTVTASIVMADGDYVYNGNAYEVNAVVNGVLDGDNVQAYVGGDETGVYAGVYSAYIAGLKSVGDAKNYYLDITQTPTENNPFVWVIRKATAPSVTNEDVNFKNEVSTYNGQIQTISPANPIIFNKNTQIEESSIAEIYQYSNEATTYSSQNGVSQVGTYKVYLTYKFKNYEDIVLTANFTINPIILDLDWNNAEGLIYNKSAHTILATLNTSDVVEGDNVELIYSNNVQTDAGKYVASVSLNNLNYVLPQEKCTFEYEIAKATIDISGLTLTNLNATYDGTAKEVQLEGILPDGIISHSITYNGSSIVPVEAGEYTVLVTFEIDEKNYIAPNSITDTLIIEEILTEAKFAESYISPSFNFLDIYEISNGEYDLTDNSTYETYSVTVIVENNSVRVESEGNIIEISDIIVKAGIIESFVYNGETYSKAV